ncbi:neutral alpha-glucosidase AB-like [Bradysia coprophila]|uniref:neutral alpha-glucosidase AB-like n=1 Tax=Bradysia coprophila TaxID=38358 RepID=UPI00187DB71A|nr:neutral alpha-glucosidase AB-like [Bradysia coprophila]
MKLMTVIWLVGLLKFSTAVDRTVFKTCEQSSFCRRCRYQNSSNYEVLGETLYTDSTNFFVDIRNEDNGHLFVLRLRGLKDNGFHFEINEKDPLKPRYRVTEALHHEPQYTTIDFTISSSAIIINSNTNWAVVSMSPFRLSFYQDDVLAVSFNAQSLMRFEHYRTRPTTPGDEELGSWEESFGDFNDTKPNGPEAVAGDFTFHTADVLFGIPEHADSFALKVTVGMEPYRLYNLDVFEYELDSRMALYGSVPVIYGHGNGQTSGIFWHNAAETFVDIRSTQSAHFMSEAGIIDVFVLLGPTPNDVFTQYAKLTGSGNLPQLFALAHHQCRWNYFTQEDVLQVISNFDANDMPVDTIWLDIEYTDDKMYFTWNHTGFPAPIEMMNDLRSTGRHLTFIIDPHTKVQDSYQYYRDNTNLDYYVKDKDGNDFVGYCWPGDSSYVDYFNPEARRFYADQFRLENFAENAEDTGIWNDMNEPSVFNGPEITMSKDNIHYNGWEHRQIHNIFGLMHVKGTFDGLTKRSHGYLRPFILTRSFYGGTQRYAAIWTGDNLSNWEHLQNSIKMCLSVSVSGISFCGSDIGGFFGDPEEDLLVRWYQAAVYQPFYRAHAHLDTKRREPYLLSEPYRSAAREALRTRYALLSFWYTLFYEHERYYAPVMRPMLAEYPLDKNVFMLDNQYMLADKLLVRPVLHKAATAAVVYFPSVDGKEQSDIWYDFDTYETVTSAGSKSIPVDSLKVPVFQKGGTIIPKKEIPRQSSSHMTNDPVSLFVAVNSENKATGTLYIDDEKSYRYRRGHYIYLRFEFGDGILTSTYVDGQMGFATESNLGRIVIAGLDDTPAYATIETMDGDAKRLEVIGGSERYFEIEASNTSLALEWKITFNNAMRKRILSSVILVTLLLHLIQYLN